ncbi:ned1 [[Candida] subhashii]|uniref:Ned1 n=1 Tax=[Candida] subhashii TaxID=561895 RepID=A0A8J5QLU6_9ASCO|nr:ned1 [[Candida] subhashii]KAG7662707.1 ned1 [[Candida] subhashii]
MQYVGKVGGYVYNQWNSLNPATLSGAIDIIVVEHADGTLHTSPWHIRFGKFQIIKPSQKKVDLYVNEIKTDLPMKLGEGGEAFFVFEVDDENREYLSNSVLTSPVISPASSPGSSPDGSPLLSPASASSPKQSGSEQAETLEDLDLNDEIEDKIRLNVTVPSPQLSSTRSKSPTPAPSSSSIRSKIVIESAKKVTQKLNIPSKVDINGDMVIDMEGYKANSQKNIENSEELFNKIFLEEIESSKDQYPIGQEIKAWEQIITKDENGNIRISNQPDFEAVDMEDDISISSSANLPTTTSTTTSTAATDNKTYFKTLRLTSEQLQQMGLHYGENTLKFKLSEGAAQITSNLYLWKSNTPIVISDIDGTITKSDALGHVLNLIGRDWTHPGVAKLFQDIRSNGYNIVYLTARSTGQADSTRQYLQGINQDGVKLPPGPVILSPDRTFAALRREVVLKKPEVFKMACLSDIKNLFFQNTTTDTSDEQTPFYAGFGNRITDAISYRSVHIPSHRIFTINPDGEVHMELLELAGYKSSYLHIGELVDHFFPPVKQGNSLDTYWNDNQLNEYMTTRSTTGDGLVSPGSPGSPRSMTEETFRTDERYNDVNYWREPINFDDLSDEEDETPAGENINGTVLSGSPNLLSGDKLHDPSREPSQEPNVNNPELIVNNRNTNRSRASTLERPTSASSFTSPLKSFMMFGKSNKTDEKVDDDDQDYEEEEEQVGLGIDSSSRDNKENESDEYTEEEDDYTDDDYDEDDYDEEEDEDYEDEEEDEEEEEDDYEDDEEYDDDEEEDLDQVPDHDDDELDIQEKDISIQNPKPIIEDDDEILVDEKTEFIKASDIESLKIGETAQ